MSKLTESLLQVILGLVILFSVVGVSAHLYEKLINEKAVLNQVVKEYNDALRQAQNTNKVLNATKKR